MARYTIKFTNNEKAKSFFKKHNISYTTIYLDDSSYFIDIDDVSILDDSKCLSYEYRPIGQPCWRPINWGYRIEVGGLYNDYIIHRFIDGFDVSNADDQTPYYIRGPWYVMTGYMGLLDAWNVTMGSGITVSCQEKFDYTHPGYHVADFDWSVTDYGNIYEQITGGSHAFFVITDSSTPSITGLLNRCFFYQSGDDYSLADASGCHNGELPYYGNYSYFEPGLCYTGWFSGQGGYETCESGLWNWSRDNVPSGFAPFGHGDITTSIFGARVTPVGTITDWGDIIGNVGIAPRCNILLGDAQDAYTVAESAMGLDVRIGAFDGQWSQTEADAAYATGTILVRSVGSFINCNTTEALGQTVPTNTVSVGTARWRGNNYNIFTQNGIETTVTGNFGMYAGYGRNDNILFATPSVGVWCHHPRYNHEGWGAWVGAYDGPSVAASVGGGLLALMKSLHTDWSWEDCITAICQTCKVCEFRTVPHNEYKFGRTVLSGSVPSGHEEDTRTLYVSGNDNLQDSVAWYHAYPSGGTCPKYMDVYGRPYSIIQFGSPGDSDYEQMYYQSLSTDGTVISGGDSEVYSGGQFNVSYRGYAGTRPEIHVTGDNIYTPLVVYSGWSPYLGWGMPNMKAAVSVTKKTMEILPPQRFTATFIESDEQYYNNKIRFEVTPFRSFNYDGFIVVKNNIWYPQNPSDGKICFRNNDTTNSIITGYDNDVINCSLYYSVFQYTKGPKVKYSRPAIYATQFIDGYSLALSNIHPIEIGDNLYIRFTMPPESQYAMVSGVWLLTSPPYKGMNTDGHVTVTGMTKGDSVIFGVYPLGVSENMVATYDVTASFNEFKAMNWNKYRLDEEYFCNGNPDHTHIQYYHDAFYGNWSQCLTVTGDPTEPVDGWSWVGVEAGTINTYIGPYDDFNFSIYARMLNGSGTLNFGINVYDNTTTLLSSLVISSVDITGSVWDRYSCVYTSGDSFSGSPYYINPFVSFRSKTSGEYSSILVSNPQATSGTSLLKMSIYPVPKYTDSTVDNNIGLYLASYTFAGEPSSINGSTIDVYDNYFNIQIDRVPESTDSGIRILGTSDKEIAFISGYGGFVNSSNTPTRVEVVNTRGKKTSFSSFVINDYRSNIASHKYIISSEQGIFTEEFEPSFVDGVTSSGKFLLEISTGGSYVPTGLHPLYDIAIPINIKRRVSDANAAVSLWYEYDSVAHHITNTYDNTYLYFRKPKEDTIKIQAVTLYGTRIESNVLYYTNG